MRNISFGACLALAWLLHLGSAASQGCCDGIPLTGFQYDTLTERSLYPDELLTCQPGFSQSNCVQQQNIPCGPKCTVPLFSLPELEFIASADLRFGVNPAKPSGSCSASVVQPESGPLDDAEFILTSAHCLKARHDTPWEKNLAISLFRDKGEADGKSCTQVQSCVLKNWVKSGGSGQHDIGIVRVSDCEEAPHGRLVLDPTGPGLPPSGLMIGEIPGFGVNGLVDDFQNPIWPDAKDFWRWVSRAFIKEHGKINGPDYLICHSAAVKGGTSGSPIMLDDLDGVFCVNSRSGAEAAICKKTSVCAPITPAVKDTLEAYMAQGTTTGLVCNPPSIQN